MAERRSDPRARLDSEDGSVLLLMPAAVLIVVVLGAIAVDAAVVYLGERQAADLSAAIANDAVALIEDAGLYERDQVCLDRAGLTAYAASRYAAASSPGFRVEFDGSDGASSRITVVDACADAGGQPVVEVVVVARVPLVFSRALPGPDEMQVDATTRVRLASD